VTTYVLERAYVDGGTRDDVAVTIQEGRFAAVRSGADRRDGEFVAGLTLPGLANCHSHAFHRALRGRTQRGSGSFWTWREQMYAAAARLDPENYYALALATYREMVASGVTSVGEFHYVHHQADGTQYADPNELGRVLIRAARDAGLRIALLDTCYLSSGFGAPVEGVQVRYSDASADGWAERVAALSGLHSGPGPGPLGDGVVIGAAIHSVRAVPRDQLAVVAAWAGGRPLHVHVSEQVAENDACRAAHGLSPTMLLAEAGALGPLTSAVHATHLTSADIAVLGQTGTFACFCPTTERDLGDGIGPSRQLAAAGSRLTLGSDSHATIDLFEEMRGTELDERLASQTRGHWSASELLAAATYDGHESLGFPDAGRIAVGARADLVTVDTQSPSTAGTGGDEFTAVFAAGASDVTRVMIDGTVRFERADATAVGRELEAAVARIWRD
jgi:formiminoglutamate deiminase